MKTNFDVLIGLHVSAMEGNRCPYGSDEMLQLAATAMAEAKRRTRRRELRRYAAAACAAFMIGMGCYACIPPREVMTARATVGVTSTYLNTTITNVLQNEANE